jgi:hypothetical protein
MRKFFEKEIIYSERKKLGATESVVLPRNRKKNIESDQFIKLQNLQKKMNRKKAMNRCIKIGETIFFCIKRNLFIIHSK